METDQILLLAFLLSFVPSRRGNQLNGNVQKDNRLLKLPIMVPSRRGNQLNGNVDVRRILEPVTSFVGPLS